MTDPQTPQDAPALLTADAAAPPSPSPPSGPLGYLREAMRIARFDAEAIRRVSEDRRALFYGAFFLAVQLFVLYLVRRQPSRLSPASPAESASLAVLILAIMAVPLQLLTSAIQVAVIHGAAKLLFGATGRYAALMRVLWLGAIVQWLSLVPLIGVLIAGVWFLLILLVTFEEIDGVERLQALMLVAGFAALTLFLAFLTALLMR